MENPDLVLQETDSRPTYSRLNYVPPGDTLCRDAISSLYGHMTSSLSYIFQQGGASRYHDSVLLKYGLDLQKCCTSAIFVYLA